MDGAVAQGWVDVVGAGCEVCGQGAGAEPAAALLRGQEPCAWRQHKALRQHRAADTWEPSGRYAFTRCAMSKPVQTRVGHCVDKAEQSRQSLRTRTTPLVSQSSQATGCLQAELVGVRHSCWVRRASLQANGELCQPRAVIRAVVTASQGTQCLCNGRALATCADLLQLRSSEFLACRRTEEPVQEVLREVQLRGTSAARWPLVEAMRGQLGQAST